MKQQIDDTFPLITLANGAITYEILDSERSIGVDLDGTLAEFVDWQGVEHIGSPLWQMIHRVQAWIRDGQPVHIFTARVNDILKFIDTNSPKFENEYNELEYSLQQKIYMDRTARKVIEKWCLNHIGVVLPITNQKTVLTKAIWDDIAVQVVPNMGETLAVPEQAEYLAEKGRTPGAIFE